MKEALCLIGVAKVETMHVGKKRKSGNRDDKRIVIIIFNVGSVGRWDILRSGGGRKRRVVLEYLEYLE